MMKIWRTINLCIKRLFDILGSAIGLIFTSPILLCVIVGIKVTMPGPVLFRQERVGLDMQSFDILKFRTMKVDKEAEQKFDNSKDRERTTPFGNVLRRTKIDELPQLVNVLIGDMSLVGPRPTILSQAKEYSEFQRKRLKMRPGMTGLAQVNGNITLSWEERIKYDVKYVNEFNVFLDCAILVKTLKVVILGEDKFKRPFT